MSIDKFISTYKLDYKVNHAATSKNIRASSKHFVSDNCPFLFCIFLQPELLDEDDDEESCEDFDNDGLDTCLNQPLYPASTNQREQFSDEIFTLIYNAQLLAQFS